MARWSDRLGRRKVVRDLVGRGRGHRHADPGDPPDVRRRLVAAAVLGVGYGIYTAVDFALITQVLPGAEERAKDLGVINIANALPQVLAPILAGTILAVVRSSGGTVATQGETWSLGYAAVYGFAFVVSILGSVFVTRIKSVA